MRSTCIARGLVLIMVVLAWGGCGRYEVIPDHLKDRVNRDVDFDGVRASPSRYQGELVVFGGEILSARRLQDKTQVEVLHLPLTEDLMPTTERTESKGRFLAFDSGEDIVDPAVLKEGTPVTVIGELTEPQIGRVDDSDYEFLTLRIRDMTVWDKQQMLPRPYPYYGYYYGYGYRPYYFATGSRY